MSGLAVKLLFYSEEVVSCISKKRKRQTSFLCQAMLTRFSLFSVLCLYQNSSFILTLFEIN